MGYTDGLRNMEEELKREFPKYENEILDLMAEIESKINSRIWKWKK